MFIVHLILKLELYGCEQETHFLSLWQAGTHASSIVQVKLCGFHSYRLVVQVHRVHRIRPDKSLSRIHTLALVLQSSATIALSIARYSRTRSLVRLVVKIWFGISILYQQGVTQNRTSIVLDTVSSLLLYYILKLVIILTINYKIQTTQNCVGSFTYLVQMDCLYTLNTYISWSFLGFTCHLSLLSMVQSRDGLSVFCPHFQNLSQVSLTLTNFVFGISMFTFQYLVILSECLLSVLPSHRMYRRRTELPPT